jgi:hypothetical protein
LNLHLSHYVSLLARRKDGKIKILHSLTARTRTSNVVESPFSRVRLRTEASRRFKSQVNATCLIWKTMMVAEMSFRKLDAPELVAKVVDETRYEDGQEIQDDRDVA